LGIALPDNLPISQILANAFEGLPRVYVSRVNYAAGNQFLPPIIEVGKGSYYWDCQYYSFDDCYRRGNILAGNRGFCTPSPYYVPGYAEQRQTRKRTARRY